jgi:hypothetical protein
MEKNMMGNGQKARKMVRELCKMTQSMRNILVVGEIINSTAMECKNIIME